MNKNRLLKLAELLETVHADAKKRKKFDMAYWFNSEIYSSRDLPKEVLKEGIHNPCGTTACAMGWAASDPWFQKAGLKLKTHFGDGYLMTDTTVYYKGNFDMYAVASFFRIKLEEAENIFYDSNYQFSYANPKNNITAKRVARRIRKFVATGKINLMSKID